MGILAKAATALQGLFGRMAREAADESRVIERTRKFTPETLAQTFVLGFLQDPKASDEKLAQMAAQCGVDVTAQAVAQRHTPKLVAFLQKLFCKATKQNLGSHRALAPILERFPSVTMLDSSSITLPDELSTQFPGCGGSYGGGEAAMKLQTELDLRGGGVPFPEKVSNQLQRLLVLIPRADLRRNLQHLRDAGPFEEGCYDGRVAGGRNHGRSQSLAPPPLDTGVIIETWPRLDEDRSDPRRLHELASPRQTSYPLLR